MTQSTCHLLWSSGRLHAVVRQQHEIGVARQIRLVQDIAALISAADHHRFSNSESAVAGAAAFSRPSIFPLP
jgi:hypothetical protein